LKECPEPTDILSFILVAPKEETDADNFISDCLKIKLSRKTLEKMRISVKKHDQSLIQENKS
jgi:hypothetical protein